MTEEEERELVALRHRVMVYEALIQADPLREIALRLGEISINLHVLVEMYRADREAEDETPPPDPPPVA